MNMNELVQNLRVRAKMTQRNFAKALGLKRRETVAYYESGRDNPNIHVLEKMAELAGLKLADLLTIPTTVEAEDRKQQDQTAKNNLAICLNNENRDLAIAFLAEFAGRRSRRDRK